VQAVSASTLHPIVKPWPFKGLGMDFISEIHRRRPRVIGLC
jgi:hypothetical protein